MSAANRIAAELFPDRVVALRVVDDPEIRRLNRLYRRTDSPTDVLSFPPTPDEMPGHAGDIALSWDAVVRQAVDNGNSSLVEAVALIAHGMLHLAGWDHPDAATQDTFDDRTRSLCKSAEIEVEVFGH